ncbi:hypothetical protein M9458_037097, partial [Cirrhinus mrigala]
MVKQLWRVFGQAQVDLFATQETPQCPLWFSLTYPAHPAPLGASTPSSPIPAGLSIVLEPDFPSRRLSMGDSRQEGSSLSGEGHHPPPPSRVVKVVGVAPEGAHLIASGLSTEVVETILQSRAPSARKLYALKWRLFTSLTAPVNCLVGTVQEFLQNRFSTGLTHSTLKVYVAAILAYHAPLGGPSVATQRGVHVFQNVVTLEA